MVDGENRIRRVNQAAEQLFRGSATYLAGQAIDALMPADSPIIGLVEQARRFRSIVAEYDVTLESPRIGSHAVDVQVSVIPEEPGAVTAIDTILRSGPDAASTEVRSLRAGTELKPTGTREGLFIEVEDNYGTKGWVSVEDLG